MTIDNKQLEKDADRVKELLPGIFGDQTEMNRFDFYRALGDELSDEMSSERFKAVTDHLEGNGTYEASRMKVKYNPEE